MKTEISSTHPDSDSSERIPFKLQVKQPNQTTLKAIQELEEGKGITAQSKTDLFNCLGVNIADI